MKCNICNNDFEYSKNNISTHKKSKKHIKLYNTIKMKQDLLNDDPKNKEKMEINKESYETITHKINEVNCLIREILIIINNN